MGINIVLFNTFCRSRRHPRIQWGRAGSQEPGELTHASKLNCSHVYCCTGPPNGHDGQKYEITFQCSYIPWETLHSLKHWYIVFTSTFYCFHHKINLRECKTFVNKQNFCRGNRNILQLNSEFLRETQKFCKWAQSFSESDAKFTNLSFSVKHKLWEWMQRFLGIHAVS